MCVEVIPGELVGMYVVLEEPRVVVRHLFEMWHDPAFIHRVTMKSSGELIVNAALGHPIQRRGHHLQSLFLATSAAVIDKQIED